MLQPFYGLDAPSRAGKPTPAATCHRELNPSYLTPARAREGLRVQLKYGS